MGARGALSELANVLRCVAFGHGCALLLPDSRAVSAVAALIPIIKKIPDCDFKAELPQINVF